MARGCCASTGLVFATIALVLALIANVSQINGTLVPRQLSIVELSTTGLQDAISAANDIGITNLTDVYAKPSEDTATRDSNHDGLRLSYSYGFWSRCAGASQGSPDYCTPRAFGAEFSPATQLLADLPDKYAAAFNKTVPASIFTDNGYLQDFTRAASLLAFAGSAAVGLGWLLAFLPWKFFFAASAVFSLVGTLALAISAVIYTIIVSRVSAAVADATVEGVKLGLTVSMGKGLYLLWGATAASLVSVLSLTFACCCGRKKEEKVKPTKFDKKAGKQRQMEKNYNALGHY